jgi:hypothetical protein
MTEIRRGSIKSLIEKKSNSKIASRRNSTVSAREDLRKKKEQDKLIFRKAMRRSKSYLFKKGSKANWDEQHRDNVRGLIKQKKNLIEYEKDAIEE